MISPLSIGSVLFATGYNYLTSRAKEDDARVRSPAQPQPVFFIPVWNAIYLGLNLFGWRSQRKPFVHASPWHQVNCTLNGYSAYLVRRQRKALELLCNFGIFATAFGYRLNMSEARLKPVDQFIRWSAELYVGWTLAATVLTASQLVRKGRIAKAVKESRPVVSNGLASVAGIASVGYGIQKTTGWTGSSAAIAWGLAGAALEKRNPRTIRMCAFAGAASFLYLALKPGAPRYDSSRPQAALA